MVEMFSVIVDLKNNVQSWHILCCLNTYNVKIEMALNRNWILRFMYIFDVYIFQCMEKFNVIDTKK